MRTTISWTVTMVALLTFHLVAPQWMPAHVLAIATMGAAVFLVCDVAFVHRWHYQTYRYSISPSRTQIAHGRVLRRERIIPIARTLGVEIVQGPLMRTFGLVELRLVTVTGTRPLGPVGREVAESMRAALTATAEGNVDD